MQTTFLKTFTNSQSFENVRVFGTVNKPLFMAKDVANMLKYKNTKYAIRDHVNKEDKIILSEYDGPDKNKYTHNPQGQSILINKKGVIKLLTKSRQIINQDTLDYFKNQFEISIESNVRFIVKEAETLGYISKAFQGLDIKCQYKISKYKVDMYIPEYKIIVECDEYNHVDRNKEYEMSRENIIKEEIQGESTIIPKATPKAKPKAKPNARPKEEAK